MPEWDLGMNEDRMESGDGWSWDGIGVVYGARMRLGWCMEPGWNWGDG